MSTVTALIPAVDEPDVDATIRSLLAQDPAPDRIVVAWNNYRDGSTAEAVARISDPRVELADLGEISGRKAGALNAVIPGVDSDYALVVDADTVMGPDFLATAVQFLDDDAHADFGAVGGVFHGVRPRGWLQMCQWLEYERFGREIARKHRVMVLTGTGSLIRTSALRVVRTARQTGYVPGTGYYDPAAITEDNEMTLALKSCGYRLASPAECSTTTELMGTWRDLSRQRVRWYRGAADNLRAYGYTATTRRYWAQQLLLALSCLTFGAYLLGSAIELAMGWIGWSPLWLGIGALFVAERVATVWPDGRRARWFAAAMLPELVYAAALQVAFIQGIAASLRGNAADWHQAKGIRDNGIHTDLAQS